MSKMVWNVVKMVYGTILRPLVEEKVAGTEAQWDDFVLGMLDRIFEYHGGE